MAKITRVGPDHPNCCQNATSTGPCSYEAVPGSIYCPLHGGAMSELAAGKKELCNYRLNALYGDRAQQMSRSPAVKNLTDEIALMRTALEVVFNNIKSDNEMLLYVDKIEKLAKGIQGLIHTWQQIQEKNKELLGRETVMAIFDSLMEKIIERVPDPDIIRQLAEDGHGIIARGLGG